MEDPLEHIHQRLVERVRQIINDHHADGLGLDGRLTCSCGAENLSDHPRHVAEKIFDGLAVKPAIDEVKKEFGMRLHGLTGSLLS